VSVFRMGVGVLKRRLSDVSRRYVSGGQWAKKKGKMGTKGSGGLEKGTDRKGQNKGQKGGKASTLNVSSHQSTAAGGFHPHPGGNTRLG